MTERERPRGVNEFGNGTILYGSHRDSQSVASALKRGKGKYGEDGC